MTQRLNTLTPNTVWTASSHLGGLLKTMAEIQADQERTRRDLMVRSNFLAKDTCY